MTPEERIDLYQQTFSSDGGDVYIGRAQIAYILDALNDSSPPPELDQVDLRELAWGFESLGIDAVRSGTPDENLIGLFESHSSFARACFRLVTSLACLTYGC